MSGEEEVEEFGAVINSGVDERIVASTCGISAENGVPELLLIIGHRALPPLIVFVSCADSSMLEVLGAGKRPLLVKKFVVESEYNLFEVVVGPAEEVIYKLLVP